MDNLSIREAKTEDVDILMQVYGNSIWKVEQALDSNLKDGFEKSDELKEDMLKDITSDNSIVLVALHNNVIVGYITASIIMFEDAYNEKISNILEIGVREDFRRLGVGKQLMDECIIVLKKRNIGYVNIRFFDENTPAKSFYIKEGFKPYSVTYRKKI